MLHELDAAGAASSPELFYNILLFTTIQILFVFFLFFPHPHFLFYQCLFGVKPFVDKLTPAHECVEKGGGGVCVRCLLHRLVSSLPSLLSSLPSLLS